jgi:hypothetical protein
MTTACGGSAPSLPGAGDFFPPPACRARRRPVSGARRPLPCRGRGTGYGGPFMPIGRTPDGPAPVGRARFYSHRKGFPGMQGGFGNRASANITRINDAPDARSALKTAFQWVESELAGIARRRSDDADALRWELVEQLALLAAGMPRRTPDSRFRGLGGDRPRLEADALAFEPGGRRP